MFSTNSSSHHNNQEESLQRRMEERKSFTHSSPALIQQAWAELDEEKKVQYLQRAIEELPIHKRQDIFGALVSDRCLAKLSPEEGVKAIQEFREISLKGAFYADDSEDDDAPEILAWYGELELWLDYSCELAETGHTEIAKQCLDLLLDLYKQAHDYASIVSGHEHGDWMIHTKHDYLAVHQQLQAPS